MATKIPMWQSLDGVFYPSQEIAEIADLKHRMREWLASELSSDPLYDPARHETLVGVIVAKLVNGPFYISYTPAPKESGDAPA